jgi:2-hydroxy-4-carboxymuconate semialdehyde hemiacetal dehydrogenase
VHTISRPATALNIALLGCGSIAAAHVRALRALGDTGPQLRTVLGRLPDSADAFGREFGFARTTNRLDDILDDPEVEAVVICSPTDAHAEQAEHALLAGKHVLCEIPLATSLAAVDRLIALADQVDRRLMVCHTERFFPALVEVRRLVQTGELHPHAVVSRFMFQQRENVNWMGRRRSWTDNLLWHHACHAVDAALWLLGAPQAGVAAQVALPSDPLDTPMDLGLVMRTPRDQVITVAMSYNTHIALHDYLVIGQETTLLFDNGELRDRDRVLVPRPAEAITHEAIGRQDAEFLAAVRDHREPSVSARAVRPAMAALQAAQESLAAHQRTEGDAAHHPARP